MISDAGLELWPRLFHNLRASRQTELENQFPTHVVCQWMGNTPKVAGKHYLQTTEDHFQMAAQGVAETVAVHPKKCAESVAVHQSTQEQERTKAPVETEAFRSDVVFCESSGNSPAPPVGLEPTTKRLTAARSTN